jgi:hypothetical protein
MRKVLTKVFQDVAEGKLTPDEAYYKFVKLKQDLYSCLANENGLVEKGNNIWVKKNPLVQNTETTYYLSKMGFNKSKHKYIEPKRITFFKMLFGLNAL